MVYYVYRNTEQYRKEKVIDMTKLMNGKELTKENLLELIEEEEIFLGGAMKKNIEKGKLEWVMNHFKLQYVEDDPDKVEYETLRDRLHKLRNRHSYLIDDYDLGGGSSFGDMAIAMGMDKEDRDRLRSKIDADREEAVKVSAEIKEVENAIKKNAYFRFLGPCVTVYDI